MPAADLLVAVTTYARHDEPREAKRYFACIVEAVAQHGNHEAVQTYNMYVAREEPDSDTVLGTIVVAKALPPMIGFTSAWRLLSDLDVGPIGAMTVDELTSLIVTDTYSVRVDHCIYEILPNGHCGCDTLRITTAADSWSIDLDTAASWEPPPVAKTSDLDLTKVLGSVRNCTMKTSARRTKISRTPSNGGDADNLSLEGLFSELMENGCEAEDVLELGSAIQDGEEFDEAMEENPEECGPDPQHEEGAPPTVLEVSPRAKLLEELSLREEYTPNKHIYYVVGGTDDGKEIFVVHSMDVTTQLKGTCRSHEPRCVCYITPRIEQWSHDELLQDLIIWSVGGRTCSSAKHLEQSDKLKIRYGMKPRPRNR